MSTHAQAGVVTFGEFALRLSAPDVTLLAAARNLGATFPAGEANVPSLLVRAGAQATFASRHARYDRGVATRSSFTCFGPPARPCRSISTAGTAPELTLLRARPVSR